MKENINHQKTSIHGYTQMMIVWRHMTDREILEKYINLENSCLNEEEKTKVMNMLFDYKEAFSLRDEIGTCPNIEVEIDVTDKSLFFIRPYHVREEDRAFIDKEMK